MRKTLTTLLAALAAVLLTSACQTVRYELRPPATETGRLCVTQCSGVRETCRGNEIQRARMEKEDCQRNNDRTVRSCLARADSPERRKDCERMRSSCYASENTERCEQDYRGCYRQCGGTVHKIVEDY